MDTRKLLTEELERYLPYNLKVKVLDYEGDVIEVKLLDIIEGKAQIEMPIFNGDKFEDETNIILVDINDVKPLLYTVRNFIELTDWFDTSDNTNIDYVANSTDRYYIDMIRKLGKRNLKNLDIEDDLMEYMLKNHIDVFGLIKSNLASNILSDEFEYFKL